MRIYIVDDHELFLQGISVLLEQYLDDVEITTFSKLEEVMSELQSNNSIDLILADIYMPKFNGKTLMELFSQSKIFIPILLVSATEDLRLIKSCLDLHASGFIHKSADHEELIKAIKAVINNGHYLDKEVESKIKRLQGNLLSPRQTEVLNLLADGLTNKRIGESLKISELTVKSHISALFDYFDAKNRLDCIRKAEKLGMVSSNNEFS